MNMSEKELYWHLEMIREWNVDHPEMVEEFGHIFDNLEDALNLKQPSISAPPG